MFSGCSLGNLGIVPEHLKLERIDCQRTCLEFAWRNLCDTLRLLPRLCRRSKRREALQHEARCHEAWDVGTLG